MAPKATELPIKMCTLVSLRMKFGVKFFQKLRRARNMNAETFRMKT